MKLIQEHVQKTIADLSATLQLLLSGHSDNDGRTASDSCERIIGAISSLSQASILISEHFQKQRILDAQTMQLILELRDTIGQQKKWAHTLKNEPVVARVNVGVNTQDNQDWVS